MNRLQQRVSNYVESDTIDGKEVVEWGIEKGGEKGAIINHFKVKKDHRRQKLGSKVLSEIEKEVYTFLQKNKESSTEEITNYLQKSDYSNIDMQVVFEKLIDYPKVESENEYVNEIRPRDIQAVKDVVWTLDNSQLPGSY